MWLKILCYCCCKRGRGPRLSAREQRKKWFRLVTVMSIKQYGTRLIANFFYAFLFAESLMSMKSIWKDFKEYSDCNNAYTANLTRRVSEQYSEAADKLAAAVMETTACMTSTLDVEVAGFSVGLGDVLGGAFGDVFGWFTPGQGRIPTADLNLQSNTDAVMQDVADDLQFLGTVAFWVRMIGFIMTFVTVAIILLKATFYTVENLPWKPGAVGLTMRFVEAFRVVAAYTVLLGAVYLQAYITDKSCDVNVNNTVIQTPMCEVSGEACEFRCVIFEQNFTSPCAECDIQYRQWWMEPTSWPNILGAVYLIFIFIVMAIELLEAGKQKKELKQAELREKEERERARQERAERKKRTKKKTSKSQPPDEQIMDANEMRIQVESDDYEEKRRRKKKSSSSSTSKSKSSSSKKKSNKTTRSKSEDLTTKDTEIAVDEDSVTVEAGHSESVPSSSYRL